VRSYPWQQLLIARAIENQCYVAGVNRVGVDGNEVNHSGDSCLLSPLGQYIWQAPANEESIYTGEWNMEALLDFRRRFPVLLDGDKFSLG
jgi:predicted amidohydrolase